MKSLVIDKVGHAGFREIGRPEPGPGELRVDVLSAGLCGSDLNTFSGLNPLVELPRIPGHEIGGRIAARGEGVDESLMVGRGVIVIPYTACGECTACRSGRVNACRFNRTLGVQQDGGLADSLIVRADRLILNDTLPPLLQALVEPLSVGFHAVDRGRIDRDDTVLVLGGGMIGAGAILGARARGARVIVSEPSDHKRAALLSLGAEAVINPVSGDPVADIDRLTDGNGADVVIEAVGAPQTFRAAIDLVCFAGRVVYVGYAKAEVAYETKLFNLKELDIHGSRNAVRADFLAVIDTLERDGAIAETLISRVFPWAEAEGAFDHWLENRDRIFKVLIDFECAVA